MSKYFYVKQFKIIRRDIQFFSKLIYRSLGPDDKVLLDSLKD